MGFLWSSLWRTVLRELRLGYETLFGGFGEQERARGLMEDAERALQEARGGEPAPVKVKKERLRSASGRPMRTCIKDPVVIDLDSDAEEEEEWMDEVRTLHLSVVVLASLLELQGTD